MVRERGGERRVRLRQHRRRLCQPAHARDGLRAAASLLRRGQRQAGRVGPRGRRHGRDNAGDGARSAGARRRHPHRRARSPRSIVEGGRARGVRLRFGGARRRAGRRRQRSPEAAVPRSRAGRRGRARTASALHRPQVGLRHLPHECRAIRAAGLPLPARQAPQDHHGSGIVIGPTHRLSGSRLSRCARARLVARAGGRDADPLDARRHAWRRPASTWPACSCSTSRRTCPMAAAGTTPRRSSPTWSSTRSTRTRPTSGPACIARQVLSPLDLERRFGLVDGDIFHGQLTLDQLFSARPVLGHADYRMPVPGALPVRLGRPPRRRRHGVARAQRRL